MMNDNNGRLPVVDAALEQFSRVTLPADVELRLEARLQEFCRQPQFPTEPVLPSPQRGNRRRFVRVSLATGLAAMVLAALFVAFGHQDAWAQVAKAMGSKPWVRWKFQVPKDMTIPEDFQAPECWFSAEKKVFAGRAILSAYYTDLAGQESYNYWPQTKTVSRSLTTDNQNVDIGHFETLLRLVSEGDRALRVSESPIQIVSRKRRDVPDGDRRWIEYTFACRDSRRTIKDYQVTFRVDPKTQLPVEMRSTEKYSSNDPADERVYAIDYPETGPGDIYALGVPRDAKVVDRRRAKVETAKEIKQFLAAYVDARSKPLERFSATVLISSPTKHLSDIFNAMLVKEDGGVEHIDHEPLMALRNSLWSKKIALPADADRLTWWKEKIEGMTSKPMHRGGEFMPHRVGYPTDLLTMGASPVDNPDCRITLDRQPMLGPKGTVLLQIRTETTGVFNDAFYWIAPDRDYMVLRHELHFSKDHAAWNNSVTIIDELKQSPGGRWYATAVRMGRIEKHGDDLSPEPVILTPEQLAKGFPTGNEIGPASTSLYRYLVEFK